MAGSEAQGSGWGSVPQAPIPDRRLRVFVSSAMEELSLERAAVRGAVTRLGLTPVMFEPGSRPYPPRGLYRAYLDQSDVFVGVYGGSYGWIAPDMEISGIEDEFDLSARLPRLLYVRTQESARDPRLAAFLERIKENVDVDVTPFHDAEELGERVADDLALLVSHRLTAELPDHDLAAVIIPGLSNSVKAARMRLLDVPGPVTAARVAAEVQAAHPDYATGLFGSLVLDTERGARRPPDLWIAAVAELYDSAEVAASRHQVLNGELLLAGLAELDRDLRGMLEVDGFLAKLTAGLEVLPRLMSSVTETIGPAAGETLLDFSTDTPGLGADVTADQDQLGIEDDVRTLCRLVLARDTRPPLAIGLFGDWGSGKSFFMRRMQTRVREMQQATLSSLRRGATTPFCDNVVQIPFNAWNYVDSNLWASLMTRIFEELAPATSDESRNYVFQRLESTRTGFEKARKLSDGANRQLESIRADRDRLERARNAIKQPGADSLSSLLEVLDSSAVSGSDSTPAPPRGIQSLDELRRVAQDARSTARLVRRLLDSWPFRVLLIAAFVIVLTALAVVAAGGGDTVRRVLASFGVIAPTVAAAMALTWRRFRRVVSLTGQADEVERWIDGRLAAMNQRVAELSQERDRASEAVDQAARTLAAVRAGTVVRQYVEDRVTNDAYRDQLGVISLVREDLRRLSELMSPIGDGDGPSLTAQLDVQRVLLYIDDLDRCPPDRVVDVLQAVHLLLAFPLFVVIVGVDARWLTTALEIHYRKLLHGDEQVERERTSTVEGWEPTPADYLDKIFQVPLALQPMTDDGYRALVRDLLPARIDDAPGDPEDASTPEVFAVSAAGVAAPGPALAEEPRRAREVRRFSVGGQPLALRFVLGGRRLAMATDQGMWIWSLGDRSPRRVVSAPLRRVAFSADRGQLLYESGERLVLLDLVTAETAMYARPSGLIVAIPGTQPGEIVAITESMLVRLRGEERVERSWRARGSVRLMVAGDYLLVHQPSLTPAVLRLSDLSDGAVPGFAGDVRDLRLDPRDRTLYLLHGRQLAVWRWADGWRAEQSSAISLPRLDGPAGLWASPRGVFVKDARGIQYVDVDRDEVVAVGPIGDRDPAQTRLFADPEVDGFVQWSGPEVVTTWGIGSASVVTELSTDPVELAALSPAGGLVATIDATNCHVWDVTGAVVDEDIEDLDITPEETAFIATLGPVVPTARSAKRLVNVYRILRASRVGRERLRKKGDEFQVALLLLSLVTSWPHLWVVVQRELQRSVTGTWTELLQSLATSNGIREELARTRGSDRVVRDLAVLTQLARLSADAPAQLDRYRDWLPHVRRFSMLSGAERAGTAPSPHPAATGA
jgi:Domain of unknown function (DUF4062)/KAP family P-loop domain